jgi:signal transduction histidine kinase
VSGPRRRTYLALLVAAVVVAPMLLLWVLITLQALTLNTSSQDCWQLLVPNVPTCDPDSVTKARWAGAIGFVAVPVVVAFVVRGLVRYVLRPLASAADVAAQMGPQNLALRLPDQSPRDELGRLAHEVNSLVDRVAAAYEGQRRFSANASHELRTPLAVQRTLVEVAMATPPDERDVELLGRQLLLTNERNIDLVDGLLVLAESDRGLSGTVPVQLDLLVCDVVDVYASRATAADVTLTVDVVRPVEIPGDPVLLERLVRNLVDNALQYNRPAGSVRITVGGQPLLVVENTGAPMPADAVPRLFEPFRRFAADRVGSPGHSGLGLAIVRSVATAHGGTAAAQPGADGGLAVSIDLPSTAGSA